MSKLKLISQKLTGLATKTFWWNLLVLGFLIWLFGWRLVALNQPTHYHANFQIYLQGQRLDFASANYYLEKSACLDRHQKNPLSRAHLHDQKPTLAHIHDQGVTWSHLLSNLGFSLSDQSLITPQGIYINGLNGQLKFILNGRSVYFVADQVIKDQDVLLINFGQESKAVLESRWRQIPQTAAAANQNPDPSSCGQSTTNGWQFLLQVFGLD